MLEDLEKKSVISLEELADKDRELVILRSDLKQKVTEMAKSKVLPPGMFLWLYVAFLFRNSM